MKLGVDKCDKASLCKVKLAITEHAQTNRHHYPNNRTRRHTQIHSSEHKRWNTIRISLKKC